MAQTGPSFLIVEDLFAAGGPQFLPQLLAFQDPKPFALFAERWLRDGRPWAREQLLAYLDLPLSAPGHNSLVKRLFKGAEARGDAQLMGAFAVAFDRLVRRVRKNRGRWNYQLRRYELESYLKSPIDTVRIFTVRFGPRAGDTIVSAPRPTARLFSYHTRHYLRRRVWRFFRRMGYRELPEYVSAVSQFLALYRDADLAAGENLLDSWSLIHVCFGQHESLAFLAHRPVQRPGSSPGALTAAPMFVELWQTADAGKLLLGLVGSAGAKLVRVWAIEMLRRWHLESLAGLTLAEIAPLLMHADEQVQTLGAELLASAKGLESASFDLWFGLLQSPNLAVLEAVAAAMRRSFTATASLTLFDAVNLTRSPAAPVARLGLYFLQMRTIASPQERQALTNLAGMKSAAAASEVIAWALGILGQTPVYDVEQISRFFDSLLPEVRMAAWAWLTPESAGWNEPALWSRLIETPHDDLRLKLVEALEVRHTIPGATANALAMIWTSVLLNIHRGGRRKLSALRQISQAVQQHPEAAEVLMPVLAVAIRSVRAPEARAGLAAIVSAVAARPELAAVAGRELPELVL